MRIITLLCLGILLALACRKSSPGNREMPPPPFPTTMSFHCMYSPDYGDTLIFPKWQGPSKDYILKPKNSNNGTYFSWPQGLALNNYTGQINISQSETGIRYVVGFVKAGTTDTCVSSLIVGGATYIDSIYVLSNNDTLAMPYFNADPVLQSICETSGDDDYPGNSGSNGQGHGNDKCEFDDDNDVDGPGIEPPPGQQANAQKVRVRTISGIINLKKTLDDGAFGANPQNGDHKEVTIYYRLNDGSGKALQKIKVNLIYFEKRTDIPVALVAEINNKRNEFLQKKLVNPGGKPRPPQIIITRFGD